VPARSALAQRTWILASPSRALDLTDEAIEFDRLDVIIVAACFYRLVAIAAHRARA
jgi:hypothetical protein